MIMGKIYEDRSVRATRSRLFKSKITFNVTMIKKLAFLLSRISTFSRRRCVVVSKIYEDGSARSRFFKSIN